MGRSEWFIRITRKGYAQLVNASAIHHAEYRANPDKEFDAYAELTIWFFNDNDVEPLIIQGHAATIAWNALNELTLRAVFSVGD